MPCCCPATLIASTREPSGSSDTAACHACSNAPHHEFGSCSLHGGVTVGCGDEVDATTSPESRSRISTLVDCVEESTPATKGTSAD